MEKDRPSEPAATAPDKPYEPPAIEWEEAVDVRANLASACGQHPLEGGTCDGNELS